MMYRTGIFILLATVITPLQAALAELQEVEVDLHGHFLGVEKEDATFVLYKVGDDKIHRYNPARAQKRFPPASTFKVPNALIALETGVAADANHTLPFRPDLRPAEGFWIPQWSQDHTLHTAMQNSVLWYYQEIARNIGPERMQAHLKSFRYGNQNIGNQIDRFWLNGDLLISPNQQVEFLERLLSDTPPASARSVKILREILVIREVNGYRLSGKTGTADVTPTRELLWLIGYVERDDATWIFALNVEGEEAWELWGPPAKRVELVEDILRTLDVLPREPSTS